MPLSHDDVFKVLIEEYTPDLVATRRYLHQHPELAFEEVRTSGLIARRLQALGLEVQTGIAQTGVVGLLRGGSASPGAKTIAIRADMDALPITKENDVAYRSRVEGTMHACGHDGHTAILLTPVGKGSSKGSVSLFSQTIHSQLVSPIFYTLMQKDGVR